MQPIRLDDLLANCGDGQDGGPGPGPALAAAELAELKRGSPVGKGRQPRRRRLSLGAAEAGTQSGKAKAMSMNPERHHPGYDACRERDFEPCFESVTRLSDPIPLFQPDPIVITLSDPLS